VREPPSIDRRLTRSDTGAAPASLPDDLNLLVRAYGRLEGRDELSGRKSITRDDAQALGRPMLQRCFDVVKPDWVTTLLRHWSPFSWVPARHPWF
jgi:hypothetical protein